MKAHAIDFTDLAILERLIAPDRRDLPADVARYVLGLKFGKSDRARMVHLAAKAREGSLTAEESEQIENYERVNHLVSLLKSKARLSLKKTSQAS